MTKEYIRRAHHAGSWYQGGPHDLNETIKTFLNEADEGIDDTISSTYSSSLGIPRGIIAPHAGYSYSGPTAGHAYKHLKEALMRGWDGTVVVLHPSHHVYLDGCAVSGASKIETPICDIPVDNALRLQLLQTGEFSTMTQKMDENEHSGEMQYPFIAQIYADVREKAKSKSNAPPSLQILPIMVGATSQSKHYGQLLAPILSRSDIFTVISTDFCHWGSRFDYSPTASSSSGSTTSFREIYEYIEWLDRQGMEKISLQDPGAFAKYMKQYKNTICGRYPIGVYLYAIQKGVGRSNNSGSSSNSSEEIELEFVKYAQSSKVKSMYESSVSYASAVMRKRL